MKIRQFEDIWFNLIEEASKNDYHFRIDNETDPILYKINEIITAKKVHDSGIISEKNEEIYNKYYIIKENENE